MMKRKQPQFVYQLNPWGPDHPEIHCPICNKLANRLNKNSPCDHVLFIYSSEAGDFIYLSEAFTKLVSKEMKRDFLKNNKEDYLRHLVDNDKLLVYQIAYGGRPCSSVFLSEVFGFDFRTVNSDIPEDIDDIMLHCIR